MSCFSETLKEDTDSFLNNKSDWRYLICCFCFCFFLACKQYRDVLLITTISNFLFEQLRSKMSTTTHGCWCEELLYFWPHTNHFFQCNVFIISLWIQPPQSWMPPEFPERSICNLSWKIPHINLPRIQTSLPNGSLHEMQLKTSTVNSQLMLSAQTKLIMLIIQEVEWSSHSEAMPELWAD